MRAIRSRAIAAGSVMGAMAFVPAFGQSTATQATLDEIIVTAEKREVNLQTLPLTVTAVTGEQLTQQGVKDITDLSRVAPEVNVNPGAMNNITIRGIRTNSFGPTLDSPNAVYVDGNFNARFTSLNGLFFDMQRIEVLNGPQGTLYGRNSAGGAINIITNKPGQEFGVDGTVEMANYNAMMLTGSLNLPLTDTIATRFSFYRSERDGFYKDTGLNDQDLQSWRAQLQWQPTDNDTLLVSAFFSKLGGKGNGASTLESVLKNPTIRTNTTTNSIVAFNAACPAGNVCTSAVVPIQASTDPWRNATLYGDANLAYVGSENEAFALQYDHTFGNFATLTFQASHMTNYVKGGSGTTAGLQQDPRLPAAQLFFSTNFGSPNFVDMNWSSQELRLTSIDTRPLQWVLGLYNFSEEGNGANPTYQRSSVTTLGNTLGSFVFPTPGPIVTQDIVNQLNETDAQAVFGQATWTPGSLENLHITAGVRYNQEDRHGVLYIYPQNGPISVGAFPPTGLFDKSKSSSSTTYKANISYDLTDGSMIYIDNSTGFQSGGYGYGSSPDYAPTEIEAWEIGWKNRFFDNQLQVNIAVWDYHYLGQTQNISDVFLVNFGGGPVPFNFITVANADVTDVEGQSIDVQWQPTPNDRLSFNVQHIDSIFTENNLTQRYIDNAAKFGTTFAALNPGYSATGDQSVPSFNYDGTRVGATPEYAVLASYEHTFRGTNFDYTPMVTYRYNGLQRAGNGVQPNMPPGEDFHNLPTWNTVDVSFDIAHVDGKYAITFWGRNVTDELYRTNRGYVANSAALYPDAALYAYTTAQYGPPLTYGVTVRAGF